MCRFFLYIRSSHNPFWGLTLCQDCGRIGGVSDQTPLCFCLHGDYTLRDRREWIISLYMKKHKAPWVAKVPLHLYHPKTASPWLGEISHPRTVSVASKASDRKTAQKVLLEEATSHGTIHFVLRAQAWCQKSCPVLLSCWQCCLERALSFVSALPWELRDCAAEDHLETKMREGMVTIASSWEPASLFWIQSCLCQV